MLGSEFSGRLLYQQNLTIDGGVHGVFPSTWLLLRSLLMQLIDYQAINCTRCALH